MKCVNCGAEIESGERICQFCGSEISASMQKENEQLNKTGCPNCGSTNIKFTREKQGELRGENGTAIVYATIGICSDCGYTWEAQTEPEEPETAAQHSQPQKPRRKTWLWVLGWIFIFPVPLTILLVRTKNVSPVLKYILIAIAWIFYIFIYVYGNASDGSKGTSSTNKSSSIEVVEIVDAGGALAPL